MIKILELKPMFTSILTTARVYAVDDITSPIIDTKKDVGSLQEFQTVLAVGNSVRDIKVGDLIKINPTAYAIKKHKDGSLKDGIISDNPVIEYRFPTVEVDGKKCLLLQDRDVDFIVTKYEDIKKTSDIIQSDNGIIL